MWMRLVVLISCTAAATPAFAQSMSSLQKLASGTAEDGPVGELTSPSNAFAVGAQLTTMLGADDGFSNGLLGSGLIKYTPFQFSNDAGGIHIFTNLSGINATVLADPDKVRDKIREVVTSAAGLELRAYVERLWENVSLWGSAAYKVNGARESEEAETELINQVRASVGAEFRAYLAGLDVTPATLSLETLYGHLLGDTEQGLLGLDSSQIYTAELTSILPLALVPSFRVAPLKNIGLFAQGLLGITDEVSTFWRVGFIVAQGN